MTMNTQQAGAYAEAIRREERTMRQNNGRAGPAGVNTGSTEAAFYDPPNPGAFDPSQANLTATIYDNAIRISSPRLVDADPADEEDVPRTVQRKVIRQVEVPYTRRVKVPVKTRKIVPHRVKKKVKTKKLVEVPSWKIVEEKYSVIEEVPAVRQKEIWVKKIVPERYMKKVEVPKVRQVKVPTTVIKEVDSFEVVEVEESKAVDVDGFRVDEVEDSKLIEVEEYQTYELRPFATGKADIVGSREIGAVRGRHHSRRVGAEVFHPSDERIREVDEDSVPDDVPRSSVRSAPRDAPAQQARAGGQRGGTQRRAGRTGNAARPPLVQSSKLGLRVNDTHANGVVVYKVTPGQAADRAGLRLGDVITYFNNRPTRTVDEFRAVVQGSSGQALLQIRRRGAGKLSLTVSR